MSATVTGTGCRECGAALGGNNASGFCTPCRARWKCAVCGATHDRRRGIYCPECRRVLDMIHAVDGRLDRWAPPDVAERVARLRARADRGLPLFGDAA